MFDMASLYDPVYAGLGVDAEIEPVNGNPVSVRAIDLTRGVAVEMTGQGGFKTATVRPAANVRAAQLRDVGISPEDMIGGTMTINGASWRIGPFIPLTSAAGDGEIQFLLSSTEDSSI